MSPAPRGLAPREGLELGLVKTGRTRPLAEPRCRPQVGKSGDPRSQNADNAPSGFRTSSEKIPQADSRPLHGMTPQDLLMEMN